MFSFGFSSTTESVASNFRHLEEDVVFLREVLVEFLVQLDRLVPLSEARVAPGQAQPVREIGRRRGCVFPALGVPLVSVGVLERALVPGGYIILIATRTHSRIYDSSRAAWSMRRTRTSRSLVKLYFP